MSRKLKLIKEQTVIIRYINDRLRYETDTSINNIDEWTTEGKITKIGRKYIEVDMGGYLDKFDIEWNYNQKVNAGSPDYRLYLSKEEIINEIKAEELYKKLHNHFGGYGNNSGEFSLSQLERILEIVNED